jgi:hypothetical protein
MTKSDSLDNITLDSDDIRTIERFENNYYNRKNNVLQNGDSKKLVKNIVRLYNCYLLSQNQNGGLSSQIKTKLDKKIAELIVYNYDLEGGVAIEDRIKNSLESLVNDSIMPFIVKQIDQNSIHTIIENFLKTQDLNKYIEKIIIDHIKPAIIDFINKQEINVAEISQQASNCVWNSITKQCSNFGQQILGNR